MKIMSYPYCCTATILVGFGESAAAEYETHHTHRLSNMTDEEAKKYIKGKLNFYKHSGMAVLTLTTNSEQHRANRLLRELGFQHSKWMSKLQHANTKVRMWWYPLEDYVHEEKTRR